MSALATGIGRTICLAALFLMASTVVVPRELAFRLVATRPRRSCACAPIVDRGIDRDLRSSYVFRALSALPSRPSPQR